MYIDDFFFANIFGPQSLGITFTTLVDFLSTRHWNARNTNSTKYKRADDNHKNRKARNLKKLWVKSSWFSESSVMGVLAA